MKLTTLLFPCCLVAGTGLGWALAVGTDIGPEMITLDINKTGKIVTDFPHYKHMQIEALKDKCENCHHTMKDGSQLAKCGTCHTEPRLKDPRTKAIGSKKAFHNLCRKCHKKQKDRPELRKCKTCHGREKSPPQRKS